MESGTEMTTMSGVRPSVTLPPLGHRQTDSSWADWSQTPFVLDDDGWRVHLDASLERWAVFVDVANQRSFACPDLWATLQEWGPAEQRFIDDFVWRKDGGMKFIVSDAGPYGEAARREAARLGTATPLAKDRMLALAERANGLIIQAVSLNAAPTEAQQQVFALRHAQLREEFACMEAEMGRVRGLIELATAALVDASTP